MPARNDIPDTSNPLDAAPSAGPRHRGPLTLTLTTLAAAGAVLVALSALSGVTVTGDGQLVAPFGPLALGTFVLTGAGLLGLMRMFRSVRHSSTCGSGAC